MKLEVRRAEARDLPGVRKMVDEYIAVDYYSEEELEDMIRGDGNLLYVVADEDRDSEIVSYFYSFMTTLDEALPLMHVSEKPEALAQYDGNTPVGVYKTTSTADGYRNLGLATSFIRGLEPEFRKRGAKMIIATALRPLGREVPMRHILHDSGFVPIGEVLRPWVEMTLYCPYCQKTHCICDAVFYVKYLEEGGDSLG